MPNDPDYNQDEYLDGCLEALDRRRRQEPCRVPRRWAIVALVVLAAWALVVGVLWLGYTAARLL